ncbi:MAG: CinA family protein [Candidatus Dormibacteria bacterium]
MREFSGIRTQGGSAEKPVGLVWVAALRRGAALQVRRLDGDIGREGIRARAVRAAIELAAELATPL